MDVDDYLKNPDLDGSDRKNIIAAYYETLDCKKEYCIKIGSKFLLVCQDKIREMEEYRSGLYIHDNAIVNEHDLDHLIVKLQVCYQLSLSKTKSTVFQFYMDRLVFDWMCKHPQYPWESLFAESQLKPKKEIPWETKDTIKKDIYLKPKCRGCCSTPIQSCAICNLIYYCSAECQRNDWQKHKIACTIFSKIKH